MMTKMTLLIPRARRTALILSLMTLIWTMLPVPREPAAAQTQPPSRVSQTPSHEQRERLKKDFRRGRDLLLEKGVPFEPEELLDPQWQRKLKPKLAQMREMQETRVVWQGQIKGVYLADVLYLPEKVEVTGDTVILANQVIFEGRDAVIKGNHAVYFFPVNATTAR